MADESLTDKFWKLAAYSAYDLLGFGAQTESNNNNNNNNKEEEEKKDIEEDKKDIKEEDNNDNKYKWPSFVKSKCNRCSWGEYDEPNASIFDVRGKNYLNDGIKIKSKKSLFKLANLELYECKVSESYHIVKNKKSWYYNYNKKLSNDIFYLIYNMQLSSLNTCVVATFVLKTNQPPSNNIKDINNLLINDQDLIDEMLNDLSDSSSSSSSSSQEIEKEIKKEKEIEEKKQEERKEKKKRLEFTVEDIENIPNIKQIIHNNNIEFCKKLWQPKCGIPQYDNTNIWNKFLNGDELFINKRLKIIPRIVEGNWYFTFPQKPALLGMKTPQRCFRGNNYLEIDCSLCDSILIAQIAKTAYHISTYLVFDVMITIEGQTKHELPERIIGGFQIRYADSTKAIKLN